MDDSHLLRAELERNYSVLEMQLKDVTHEESLIQPPYSGNCLNWILGHLVLSRGTLLKLEIETGETDKTVEDWYFINTVKGRQTLALVRQGKLEELRSVLPAEARLKVERPNVFALYEQNIGLLTPLIADQLRDLEKSYPPDWIDEAFTIAVAGNKRALRYIQAILKRWETEGKNDRTHETREHDSEADLRRKYIPNEYSDIILG